jgi:histidyl-tRNA synthetase
MPPDSVETTDMTDSPEPANGTPPRASGMRDLGPDRVASFRAVEHVFLEVTAAAGYREIRTPTLEPLHLYTSTGSLSPELLDRVYSFLDWDGWSGERVVLRPDATVPAARWYQEHGDAGTARLSYVQPVYRFSADGRDRELWQCGVELFGVAAPEGDTELLRLALDFVRALGIEVTHVDVSHAGLVRAALEAAGLTVEEQVRAYDRLLAGDADIEALLAEHRQGSSALRLLFGVDGDAAGYLANLRATLVAAVPAAAEAVEELEAVAAALEAAGASYRIRPATARNFEYYTGTTFAIRAGERECIAGGRYDGLAGAFGGRPSPASGFAADVLDLASLAHLEGGLA